MSNIVYIRADGNSDIGLGHLVRCLALSYMIHTAFKVNFVCKSIPENILKEIKSGGFLYTQIQREEEFLGVLTQSDIVVLDHYGLDDGYQRDIKEKGCKLVCIDDLHNGNFYADLIINHAPGVKTNDYKTQPYTQFALGLEYALLRPEFLASVQHEKTQKEQGTMLICFGGSDNQNLTKKSLQIVIDSKQFKRIIVIIGDAYQYKESLVEIIGKENNIQLYHAIKAGKMLELMQLATIAIVPSSGILLEVISTGCKVISGKYVDNQQYIYSQYKGINAFVDAKDFSEGAIKGALKSYAEEQDRKIPVLIDGLSGNRLLKLFVQLRDEGDICLRNASPNDIQTTFLWAKDKRIRAFSFSQTEIAEEEHRLWFSNKLKSDDCFYFIAEFKGQAVGSIRFDIHDGIGTISYLIDPDYHGRGFGVLLLKVGIEKVLSHSGKKRIEAIIGYVMPNNVPSVKAFERLGFRKEVEGINLRFSKNI